MPHTPARILFVFIDGLGLGPASSTNPLSTETRPHFEQLAGDQPWIRRATPVDTANHVFRPLDANLDVEGLPQSGTGQATLLTGVNCAKVVGRHFGPFPHSTTRPVLAQENVFAKVQAVRPGGPDAVAFANAYPPRFFDYVQERDRWTVTTRCCLEADVPIRGVKALLDGHALTADLTGEGWHRIGHDVPPISEDEAGARLVATSRDHAFTLYEHFLTDKAGHGRLDRSPADVLDALELFFQGILATLDPADELLLITSDHGNLEDMSTTTHTRHPVPLVAFGRGAHHFRTATSIADVTPAIVAALDRPSD